jgi:hypothetical protein
MKWLSETVEERLESPFHLMNGEKYFILKLVIMKECWTLYCGCPRGRDHPVPEGYKYGDLALQVGGV